MKNWKVKLTAGEETLAEIKIKGDIFQGNLLTPLFVIVMVSLNNVPRKCTKDCKFTKSQEIINHLMCMDDTKLFAKK